ncbi:MAG: PepSY-associated helix domain protein [Xanthobacteraceae bacterium]|jgi:uncharacterized iron-regulated membrane protein|nr:PepSY-associated helix domain protein [Xanthobacteraceae bacterium]
MDARPDVPKVRKRPLLPPDFVRSMLAGHSALGIAFAALIYVVCISGALAVFVNELQRWEQPDAPVVARGITPEVVTAVVAAGYEQAKADGAAHDIFVMGPGASSSRLAVFYHDDETGVEGEWLADAEGRLVTPIKAPWTQFIAELHMALHLPRTWGLFLVGLVGVTLLSSLISGLLSHPRIFKDAFALRWGGSRRLQEADLHNRLAVWGLPFHFAVSLTGALIGLSTLIVGVLAMAAYDGNSEKAFAAILGPLAREDERPAPLPDIAGMIAQVRASSPKAEFVSANIQHVATAGQVVHLGMKTPGHLAMSNAYYFDAAGTSLGDGGLETGGIGQQILGALQPLHFGWFGGMPVKLAYGILGIALSIVAHNGVTIWLVRRRDKGRPAPGWEKAWSAIGWSQPLAFGTTATAALVAGMPALPVYGATLAAALVWARLAPDAARTGRILRLASAATLVAVVAIHMAKWGVGATDPMALYVNAGILAVAFALALPSVVGRASAPA